ncbi:MAG: hypothetical protein IT237_07095 [Bacteroidia bacterium]|nr:hypothetical protein [Bacteroidia bacterium]
MSINTSEGLVKGHNNAQKFFATTCILPSGSSSDFKFSSGTTFPELEIIGSYTGSGIVFGKPSYNIRDYINTFVFNAQGGGLPTAENGGVINNTFDFMSFMMDQAKNNPDEVAAWGLKNGTFYVQPWNENSPTNSVNSRSRPQMKALGIKPSDVISQYHTHPSDTYPSYDDARASQYWQFPVNVINNHGDHWQISPYPLELKVPSDLLYYGFKQ